MTALFFTLAIIAMFAILVAAESGPDDSRPQLIQTGLLKWLVTGNWPAKVGAGLLLIGVGALLRYALIHIEVPPTLKLGSGLLIAAALAGVAFVLRTRPERRAIHVALAGAAAGVAYLTAYAAYGFFGYVTEFNALVMLAMVAVLTGVFAVNSNSMSVGILAMAGAYIAPAFALKAAGPQAVYGYYVAISALSLVMVTMRGWRGLIHLSFLFTLAGAVFFAWTAKFYQPEYYAVMQPMLLALAAIHLAMPLVERRHLPSRWLSRFDTGYFVALPLLSAGLTMSIAPDWRQQGALGLALLAGIWGLAAGVLKALKRDEALRHALVAALLLVAAALCKLDDVPWLLFGLGMSVAALAVAPRLGWSRSNEELACGSIALFGLLHVAASLMEPMPTVAFANVLFGKRLIASALLGIGAGIAWRRQLDTTRILVTMAISWLLLSVSDELRRLFINMIAQFVYAMLLALIVVTALIHRWTRLSSLMPSLLVIALTLCGWWSVHDASRAFSLACLLLTPAVLLGFAYGRAWPERDDDTAAIFAFLLLPLTLVPWAQAVFAGPGSQAAYMAVVVATAGVVAVWWLAPKWQPKNSSVDGPLLPAHFMVVAACLIWLCLNHIERGAPAITFDLLGAAYMLLFATGRDIAGKPRSIGYGITAVVAVALVLQAMLLRLLGPDRVMTVADLAQMHLPVVVSLMWATLGAGLAWWGTRRISRTVWAAGAALLVVSALKMVLLDFGSLGQLSNILALIAAGLVFMGVAWFAPIPPKPTPPEAPEPPPVPPSERARPRPTPPPIPPAPAASTASPVAMDARAPETGSTSTPLTNRAVFPAPPPLPETPAVNDPGQSSATMAERARPASASATSGSMEDELMRKVRLAAEAAAAKQARADKDSDGPWLKIVTILILVAIGVAGLKAEYSRSQRPQLAQGNAQTPAPMPESNGASDAGAAPEVQPSAVSAAVSDPTPAHSPSNEPTIIETDACKAFAESFSLPSDYSILATGAYGGKKVGFQIDHSGEEATQIDVTVNSPDKPVVVLLGAHDPTIWNISRTAKTNVIAVIATGYYRQAVAGLEHGTPLLISTQDNGAPCGYFYYGSGSIGGSAGAVARHAFDRPVETVYVGSPGAAVVGTPVSYGAALVKSWETTPESFRDKSIPPVGRAGLDEALRKGVLRLTTDYDWQVWSGAVARDAGRHDLPPAWGSSSLEPGHFSAYVVVKPFTFPSGLVGADAVTFFVPEGVPVPDGDPGHSMVYAFDNSVCQRASYRDSVHLVCPATKAR